MKVYEEIDKNPPRADQLKAGAAILIGCGVLGAVQLFWRHRVMVAELLWVVGAVAFIVSLVPGLGRLLYIGWMGLGVTIGICTQPVIVAIAYVVLFVPLGLVFRALGRDLMKRRMAPQSASYWEDCDEPEEPTTYFKPY